MTPERQQAVDELRHPHHLWWVWVHTSEDELRVQAQPVALATVQRLIGEGVEIVAVAREQLKRGAFAPTQAREMLQRATEQLELGLRALDGDQLWREMARAAAAPKTAEHKGQRLVRYRR